MTVQLFIPCFMDQLYPQAAFNTIKVLEKAGCKVKYNEKQTCCGQPAFNAGFWSESKDVCTKFVQDFDGADYIVSPSASCTGFVRNNFGKIFENNAFQSPAKKVTNRMFELSEFLVKILNVTDLGAKFEGKATYHDSCAGLRECMADQKIENIINTKAEYLISTDSSCLMHLDGRMKFNGNNVQILHLADVLASGY
jgi:L-lactate dehydrogenase complex protein LldE